jgi:hypothetical protein
MTCKVFNNCIICYSNSIAIWKFKLGNRKLIAWDKAKQKTMFDFFELQMQLERLSKVFK